MFSLLQFSQPIRHRPVVANGSAPWCMVRLFRREKGEFTLVDGLILVAVMVVVSGSAIPILEAVSRRAKVSAMLQSLRTFRAQIELYKLEHNGEPPLLYEGAFPQLTSATNRRGIPGRKGPNHPYGPYLQGGVPINPMTNGYLVTPTEVFPPLETTNNGGWLYHQPTGQIAADVDGYLQH